MYEDLAVETSLVRIGNSQGVRLPKAVIEQAGLTEHLELVVAKGAIMEGWNSKIIRALKLPLPPLDLQRQYGREIRRATQHLGHGLQLERPSRTARPKDRPAGANDGLQPIHHGADQVHGAGA